MTNRTVLAYVGDSPVDIGTSAAATPSRVHPGDLTVVEPSAVDAMVGSGLFERPAKARLSDELATRKLPHTGTVDDLNARLAEATLEYVAAPEPEPEPVTDEAAPAETEPNGQDA